MYRIELLSTRQLQLYVTLNLPKKTDKYLSQNHYKCTGYMI